MLDPSLVAIFIVGALMSTAIYNMAIRQAKKTQNLAVVLLGFYTLQVNALAALLWAHILGIDMWGMLKEITVFFLGTTIHPTLPGNR